MSADILERVKLRLPEESNIDLLGELISTMTDRVCLRVQENELPEVLESITTEAVIKVYRRQYFEGISDERADSLNLSFFEDVLGEYEEEFNAFKNMKKKQEDEEGNKKVVRFI